MRGHKRKRQSEERSGGRCTAQPQTWQAAQGSSRN
jgi:hypothetical protein